MTLPLKALFGLGALGGSVSVVTVPAVVFNNREKEFVFKGGTNGEVSIYCPIYNGWFTSLDLNWTDKKIRCSRENIEPSDRTLTNQKEGMEQTEKFECSFSGGKYSCSFKEPSSKSFSLVKGQEVSSGALIPFLEIKTS